MKCHDQQIMQAINREMDRQKKNLELIASENIVSESVLYAMGSILTNKYAEGYPGKRYYGGCEHVDEVEDLARSRAKQLFQADHVNVQPHSGAQANMAVYFAALKPGDTVLGMSLDHGGHLTHGSPVNASGQLYSFVSYGVDEHTHLINYENIRKLAHQCKPRLIIAGASAYPREIDFQKFSDIAKEVDALLMVDMAHIAGLVAAGVHPSPIPYADFVTTTTHKTLRGPRGGMILCKEPWAKAIDKAIFPGSQGGPLMHIIAAKAVSFLEALQPEFKAYAKQVVLNAKELAEVFAKEAIQLVSGGTDNHMLLVDLRNLGLTGKKVEKVMDEVGITVNKNAIPNDPTGPFITSGIRIGTPAVTSRGMKQAEMKEIGACIALVLKNIDQPSVLEQVKLRVEKLTQNFPIYPEA